MRLANFNAATGFADTGFADTGFQDTAVQQSFPRFLNATQAVSFAAVT